MNIQTKFQVNDKVFVKQKLFPHSYVYDTINEIKITVTKNSYTIMYALNMSKELCREQDCISFDEFLPKVNYE